MDQIGDSSRSDTEKLQMLYGPDGLERLLINSLVGDDDVKVSDVCKMPGLDHPKLGGISNQDFCYRGFQGCLLGSALKEVGARDTQLQADPTGGDEGFVGPILLQQVEALVAFQHHGAPMVIAPGDNKGAIGF